MDVHKHQAAGRSIYKYLSRCHLNMYKSVNKMMKILKKSQHQNQEMAFVGTAQNGGITVLDTCYTCPCFTSGVILHYLLLPAPSKI